MKEETLTPKKKKRKTILKTVYIKGTNIPMKTIKVYAK